MMKIGGNDNPDGRTPLPQELSGPARRSRSTFSTVTLTDNVTTILLRCLLYNKPFRTLRRTRKTCSPACRQRLSRGLRAARPPLPSGPFELIFVELPWDFVAYSAWHTWSPSDHFRSMGGDYNSICRLPISRIAAPDAGLALCAYGPAIPAAYMLMKRWGFGPTVDLIDWIKKTSRGEPPSRRGHYFTRDYGEQLLYRIRGLGLKLLDSGVSRCLLAEEREHGCTPDEAADALEHLFGPAPRIELFARRRRPGWEAWGNEQSEIWQHRRH